MWARPSAFRRQEEGSPRDDFPPVGEEFLEGLLERERPRLILYDRQELHPEGNLHLGELVEVVQNHLGDGVLLQLDHHPRPVPVGLVAQVGDLLDLPVPGQLRDPLQEARLVHLVGDLGDHDRLPVPFLRLLDEGPRADLDVSLSRPVRLPYPLEPVEDPARREVGGGDELHQFLGREVGVLDQGEESVDHLPHVVGRDRGGHADGDAGTAVDEEGGNPRREDPRLRKRPVVVRHRFHRLLVEVGEEFGGDLRETHLGVPHRGGGVAVHRPEVPLPVDQGVAKGELLDHPHEGIVDRRVAVGVVLPDHVPHDAGRFLVRFPVLVPQFVHRVEDAALDGFETVPHVGQGPPDDHAHRVIEVALAHLVLHGARHGLLGKEIHVVPGAPVNAGI